MKKVTWQDKTLFTERDLSMNTNKILLMILNRLVFNNSMGDMRFNEVLTECEHQQEIDRNLGKTLSQQYSCFDLGQNSRVYDVGLDIGITWKQVEDAMTR